MVNPTMKASSRIRPMAQISDQSDYLKTALRLPRDLHAHIQEAAEEAGRSQNAEIVARLASSFEQNPNAEALQLQIQHLEQRIKDLKHGLLLEATLGALTAFSLKELSHKIPSELREALSVASAEALADKILAKPHPDEHTSPLVRATDETAQMLRRFLDENRAEHGK